MVVTCPGHGPGWGVREGRTLTGQAWVWPRGEWGPWDCSHGGVASSKQAEVPLAERGWEAAGRESPCIRTEATVAPTNAGAGEQRCLPLPGEAPAASSSLPRAHSGCWASSLAGSWGSGWSGCQAARVLRAFPWQQLGQLTAHLSGHSGASPRTVRPRPTS